MQISLNHILLLGLGSLLFAEHASTTVLNKVMLTHGTSRCNDGSIPVYYEKVQDNSNKWVLALEGGADCYNDSSCKDRYENVPYLMQGGQKLADIFQTNSLYSQDCKLNLAFCNFNKIFIHYCSSDRWVGHTEKSDQSQFRFQGSLIVEEVVRDLQQRYSEHLSKDVQFILTGSSAGGNGAYLNAKNVRELLKRKANSVDFRMIVDSAHWLDGQIYQMSACEIDECDIQTRFTQALQNLWNPKLDDSCPSKETKDVYECVLQKEVVRHFDFPVLSIGYTYDLRQAFYDGIHKQKDFTEEEMAHILKKGNQLHNELEALSTKNSFSYFYLGCFYHGIIFNPTGYNLVWNEDQFTISKAVQQWMEGKKLQVLKECDLKSLDCAHNCASLFAQKYGNYDDKIKSSQDQSSDL